MKKLLIALLILISVRSSANTNADPTLVGMSITTTGGASIPGQQLVNGAIYQLHLIIQNLNQVNAIPSGSCIITINLGPGMILSPGFNLSTAPLSNYFHWTYSVNGVTGTLVGECIAPIPAFFINEAVFEVKAQTPPDPNNIAPSYGITANFLVTNHNTGGNNLTDDNPGNNSTSTTYGVTAAITLPVNFISTNAYGKNCNIIIDWKMGDEQAGTSYVIETSKDGFNFTSKGSVATGNAGVHHFEFPVSADMAATQYIRIRATEASGSVQFSRMMPVKNACSETRAFQLVVYPNPAQNISEVTVLTRGALFNGKITYTLTDAAGKTILVKQMTMVNDNQFKVNISTLAQGVYNIKVYDGDQNESNALRFEKIH